MYRDHTVLDTVKQGKRKKIRKFGEVFSSEPLVSLALGHLPAKLWTDPTVVFLEPTCGDGAIASSILERRKKAVGGAVALETLFALELQEKNVLACRERLLALVPGEPQAKRILNQHVRRGDRLKAKLDLSPFSHE